MRGTIGMVGVKCGRPGCACTQGVKHRKVHLSVNLHGRTRSCDLWREREALVAPLLAEYERAWRLITALTTVNLAVLQADGGLGRLVERQLPSADTLRRFLYAFHNEQQRRAGLPAHGGVLGLFTLAGRLLTHAGQRVLRVGGAAERLAGLIAARHQLALVAQALPAG